MKLICLIIALFLTSPSLAFTSKFDQLENISQSGKGFVSEAKTQLVVLWATWCNECKKKLVTTLPEWHEQSDLNIVSINIDANPERAASFLQIAGIKIPVFKEKDSFLQKRLNVIGVPHWAVFKKEEKSKASWKLIKHDGGFDEERILKIINGEVKRHS